jgi:dihydrofolate reductase
VARLLTFNMMSLDGFFEGPDHDLGWHNVDEEFSRFAVEQLAQVDTLVFGRRTYEMMAGFWPTDEALRADPDTAEAMNRLPKMVFSRSLVAVGWHHARLAGQDMAAEIAALKRAAVGDVAIFGSANLIASMAPLDVIDEHRVMLNPVVLGRGTPLFQGIATARSLRLVSARPFPNGNVLLRYVPARRA